MLSDYEYIPRWVDYEYISLWDKRMLKDNIVKVFRKTWVV